MKKKVAVTGACGIIAQRVLPDLAGRYDLTLIDIRDTDSAGNRVPGVVRADLLDDDRTTYRDLFRGHDAVIHSGFVRPAGSGLVDPGGGSDRFRAEMDNIRMAYNVMQACVEAGVPRIVVMSSNHAADFYEPLVHSGDCFGVTPSTPSYSDNFYGWAKVSYEALGFLFATGRENGGRVLEVVQLRIGAPRESDIEQVEPGDTTQMRRALGAYISVRDEVQLITKSIDTKDIRNEHDVPFQIFYGISGNSCRFWDISNAKRIVGYEPQDDAMVLFRDHIARIATGQSL